MRHFVVAVGLVLVSAGEHTGQRLNDHMSDPISRIYPDRCRPGPWIFPSWSARRGRHRTVRASWRYCGGIGYRGGVTYRAFIDRATVLVSTQVPAGTGGLRGRDAAGSPVLSRHEQRLRGAKFGSLRLLKGSLCCVPASPFFHRQKPSWPYGPRIGFRQTDA